MKKLYFILALLLIGILALSACGGGATTTTTTTTPSGTTTATTTSTPTTTTSTAVDKYGGTLTTMFKYTIASTPGWPTDTANAQRGSIAWTVYEPMVKLDMKGDPIPWLATSWEWAPDKTYITFELRQGVKFSDGTEFKSDAVKLETDFVKEAKLTNANDWDHWEILGDYSIRLYLTAYHTDFWSSMTGINMSFFSPTAYAEHGKEWITEHPVGTGPFLFDSFEKDVSLKVVRNPNYWQEGKPYLNGITTLIVKDETTRRLTLESGEVDLTVLESAKFLNDMKQKGFTVLSQFGGTDFIMFDTMNPDTIYNDARIRQAIEYSIDKTTIADSLGYGYYIANNQMPPPDNPSHNNDLPTREYNPEKAKELLTEAGYPNGFEANMITIGTSPTAQIIQESLKQVGIDVTFESVDNAKFWDYNMNGWDNAMVYVGFAVGINYPAWLKSYFPPTGIFDASVKLPDAILDGIAPALSEQDPVIAKQLSDELIRLTWDSAILVPIYSNALGNIISPKVHDTGYFEYSDFSIWNPELVWKEK